MGTASAEGYPASFCDCPRCRRARLLGGWNIRTRSSIIVDNTLLVDLTPDFYAQTNRCGVNRNNIRILLFTHMHPDHFYIEELRLRREPFANSKIRQLVAVGSFAVAKVLRREYKGMLRKMNMRVTAVKPGEALRVGGYEIVAVPATHDPSRRDETPLNYIISDGEKTMLYAVDTGPYGKHALSIIARYRLDLVVMDATMGWLGSKAYMYHMGFEDDQRLKRWMIENGVAGGDTVFVLTHFSHNATPPHDELVKELKESGYDFLAAYDCMKIEV